MRHFTRAVVFTGLVCGALLHRPSSAQAAVVVLGNGMGYRCYEMALAMSLGFPQPEYAHTDTEKTQTPVEACSAAISAQQMDAHDLAGSYVNRGVLYFLELRYDAALKDFDQAIRIDASIADAYANKGAVLVALHQWADSVAATTKGIQMGSSEQAKAYFNRALASEELGKVKDAYFDFLEASELAPDWAQPKFELEHFSVRRVSEAPAPKVEDQPSSS